MTVGPHVGRARQPAQRLVVVLVGQHVRALEPLQLQPVLEQPQELVRRGQVGGVVAADVPAVTQRGQRVDRRRHMQRLVVAAVHQLQQLHGELDVAQAAGAELELPVPHVGGHQRLDPAAHRLHLGHEVLTLARRPHHRHQRRDVLLAELGVTGRGPRLHQRLELPGLGPALVVGDVRVQRPHQLRRACPPAAAPRRPRRTSSDANRIISPATRVVTASASSATKMTSTSLT